VLTRGATITAGAKRNPLTRFGAEARAPLRFGSHADRDRRRFADVSTLTHLAAWGRLLRGRAHLADRPTLGDHHRQPATEARTGPLVRATLSKSPTRRPEETAACSSSRGPTLRIAGKTRKEPTFPDDPPTSRLHLLRRQQFGATKRDRRVAHRGARADHWPLVGVLDAAGSVLVGLSGLDLRALVLRAQWYARSASLRGGGGVEARGKRRKLD